MDAKTWEELAKKAASMNANDYDVGFLLGLSANYDFQKMVRRPDGEPSKPEKRTA